MKLDKYSSDKNTATKRQKSYNYLSHDRRRQNENDIPIEDDIVAENWARNEKGNNIGYILKRQTRIKIKPRFCILFLFDLDGECKFIKNKTL